MSLSEKDRARFDAAALAYRDALVTFAEFTATDEGHDEAQDALNEAYGEMVNIIQGAAREEPSQEAAGEPVAATINWLRSLQGNGHCDEGTSERIQRERRNEHLDIAVKALTSPTDPQARITVLEDKVEALDSELHSAVEVAYRRGAHDWVRLNYPRWFAALTQGPHP